MGLSRPSRVPPLPLPAVNGGKNPRLKMGLDPIVMLMGALEALGGIAVALPVVLPLVVVAVAAAVVVVVVAVVLLAAALPVVALPEVASVVAVVGVVVVEDAVRSRSKFAAAKLAPPTERDSLQGKQGGGGVILHYNAQHVQNDVT